MRSSKLGYFYVLADLIVYLAYNKFLTCCRPFSGRKLCSFCAKPIRAAMLDLRSAMARAVPHPMTISKEEWLAKRGTIPRDVQRRSCASSSQVLADIPSAVPELQMLISSAKRSRAAQSALSEGTSSCTTRRPRRAKEDRRARHGRRTTLIQFFR